MSLAKAIGKYTLRYANDTVYRSAQKRVQKKAYTITGKELQKASKSGRRVNGSNLYKRNYFKIMQKLDDKKNRRDHFIADL